jgi:hypothetical protein
VPGLKLLVKAFNKVIGNIIFKAFNPNVFPFVKYRFNRHFTSNVPIRDNWGRIALFPCFMKPGNSLGRIMARRYRIRISSKSGIKLQSYDANCHLWLLLSN